MPPSADGHPRRSEGRISSEPNGGERVRDAARNRRRARRAPSICKRVLELALAKAEELCRAETSSIWELDERARRAVLPRRARPRRERDPRPARAARAGHRRQRGAHSGSAEVVNDAQPTRAGAATPASSSTRALLAVPLVARGRVVGVLQLLNPIGRARLHRRATSTACGCSPGRWPTRWRTRVSTPAQKRQFVAIVTALAEAIEKRDPYTGGHVRRVVAY